MNADGVGMPDGPILCSAIQHNLQFNLDTGKYHVEPSGIILCNIGILVTGI